MNSLSLKEGQTSSVCSLVIEGSSWAAHSIRNPYLRSHIRALSRMVDHDRGEAKPLLLWLGRILPSVELRTPLLTQVRRDVLNTMPVLVRLAAHHRDWIRDPETWQPDLCKSPRDLLVSLIEHLLARYPLPRFCENAWFIDGPLAHIEREWFCHLGQGKNVRTFGGWMPLISRRAAHEFYSAPTHFQMREALRYGQAQAIVKDRDMSCAIAKSRLGLDFIHDAIWIPFFGMWANSRRDPEEFFLVADYLWAQAQENDIHGFNLTGRNFPSLVQSAKRFFKKLSEPELPGDSARISGGELNASHRNFLLDRRLSQWEPLEGVGPYVTERSGWRYEIRELINATELLAEGSDMAHCVGGYGSRCRTGSSSIFSLRSCDLENGVLDREVTMEVSRLSRRLVQARAWKNSLPHPTTRRIILEWCLQFGISAKA